MARTLESLTSQISKALNISPEQFLKIYGKEKQVIIRQIFAHMKTERIKGEINHWSYNINRHELLSSTYKILIKEQ